MASDLEATVWAERNFTECELGDVRRTKRLVRFAARMAAHPEGSTPQQAEGWADCKAAYRLFDRKEVTFESVCEPHWGRTRERAAAGGTWLLIGDTTEVSYGPARRITGLGPLGNGLGRGFLLHTSLMVHAETGEVAGVAAADLFLREPAPKGESPAKRVKRPRESEVWGRVIDRAGAPPPEARFVHVLDAAADNFENFLHLSEQHADWVIRAGCRARGVHDAEGNRVKLFDHVAGQPSAGSYELHLRSRPGVAARTATVEVRHAPLHVPSPANRSAYVRERDPDPIPTWAIEVREVDAPAGVDPLRWVLLTSEPVEDFETAWTVIGWYEQRPIVEDYHKCLKTGCRVEQRQYETAERLRGVIGLSTVVAARLLELKFVARADPERPATSLVPREWLRMLAALRAGPPITTVRDCFRRLAMLGGFLGRKHDGEPGWITIWRGLRQLTVSLKAMRAVRERCG